MLLFKLLSVTSLKWSFLAFPQSLFHYFSVFFLVLKVSSESQSWCFFFSMDLFIIAFLNSFVINGALFPLMIFSFRGACLFTLALKVLQKLSYIFFSLQNFSVICFGGIFLKVVFRHVELNEILNKAINSYENIIAIGLPLQLCFRSYLLLSEVSYYNYVFVAIYCFIKCFIQLNKKTHICYFLEEAFTQGF